MEQLNFGFFISCKIKIKYQSENNSITKRIVEPHYLLLNWPVWYLLAWDELRAEVRLFRTDRILQIDQLNEPNKRRPKSVFLKSIEEYFKYI
jgi:predicted DNA-binding transcriptional regulator YafY